MDGVGGYMYVFRTINSLSISFCIVPRRDVNTEAFLSSSSDDDDDDDITCPLLRPSRNLDIEPNASCCSIASWIYIPNTGSTAPFIVIDTDICSNGISLNNAFISNIESIGTPAIPTSPTTRQ